MITKQYADQRRHTKPNVLLINNMVRVKIQKQNKTDSSFSSYLLKIVKIVRTEIIAKREYSDVEVKRNASHFMLATENQTVFKR